VSGASSFLVARTDGHLYVRAVGLANMKSAPMLDAFLRSEQAVMVEPLTACIDLSDCTGMDSTFMGLLVGSAESFAASGGRVVLVNPSVTNMKLLETLGVTAVVMVVSKCTAPLAEFVALASSSVGGQVERINLVRRAHNHLIGLSAANKEKFGAFVAALEQDLARQRLAAVTSGTEAVIPAGDTTVAVAPESDVAAPQVAKCETQGESPLATVVSENIENPAVLEGVPGGEAIPSGTGQAGGLTPPAGLP